MCVSALAQMARSPRARNDHDRRATRERKICMSHGATQFPFPFAAFNKLQQQSETSRVRFVEGFPTPFPASSPSLLRSRRPVHVPVSTQNAHSEGRYDFGAFFGQNSFRLKHGRFFQSHDSDCKGPLSLISPLYSFSRVEKQNESIPAYQTPKQNPKSTQLRHRRCGSFPFFQNNFVAACGEPITQLRFSIPPPHP